MLELRFYIFTQPSYDVPMMFILEIIFEFFGVVVFEAAANLIASRLQQGRVIAHKSVSVFLFLAGIGAALGYFSTYFYGAQIASESAKIGHMLATPVAMGAIMHLIGHYKTKTGRDLVSLDHFLGGYFFSLAFVVVRFKYA